MGEIKLPIPIFCDDKRHEKVNSIEITAGVIADTKKVIDQGDPYKGMQIFISGCLESIDPIVDKSAIKLLTGMMPYRSAEYLSMKIITQNEDDGIEGMYNCPRCDKAIICEKTENVDRRDFLSDLDIFYSNGSNTFEYKFESPITVPAKEDEITDIVSITLRYPTLNDCSAAILQLGEIDKVRLQFGIYLEALEKVNGESVSSKWKSRYGMSMFDQIKRKDIQKLGELITRYGLDIEVAKTCPACGKVFKTPINTSNFFVSALRSE